MFVTLGVIQVFLSEYELKWSCVGENGGKWVKLGAKSGILELI